jgi:starch phosphorylase
VTAGGGSASLDAARADPWAAARALARNWRWTGDPRARACLRDLCGDAWGPSAENPAACLPRPGDGRAAPPAPLLARAARALADLERHLGLPPEGEDSGISPERPVAYVCAEFGLGAALPVYSGGLGVLAGDHLRAASDLRLPLVGVGLLYRRGYARQTVRPDGLPESRPDPFDPASRGLEPVEDDRGDPLEATLPLRPPVVLRAWRADVGRVPLYLLDADHEANDDATRALSHALYGGDATHRLRQELLLGFGAPAFLAAAGLRPAVWHVNEGHGAFCGVARLREAVGEGRSFDEARAEVAAATWFTTHTPVAAGHDRFAPQAVRERLPEDLAAEGAWERVLALARNEAQPDTFDMTALACRLAGGVNGVSERHREVSQALLGTMLGADAPRVVAVTNGVHLGAWTGEALAAEVAPDATPAGDDFARRAPAIPAEDLWRLRAAPRRRLLDAIRTQVRWGVGPAARASAALRERMEAGLDEGALWIGFARRFAAYKRADLVFRDEERLRALLASPERPVRIVLAGKAHPADARAKEVLAGLAARCASEEWAGLVYLLEGYDVALARALVQGADVWLNTPRAPLEACGTSGMKAAANGALHVSVPDGWWPEAFDGTNGWTVGDGSAEGGDEAQDARDAEALHATLEREVVPLFFRRDGDGVPREWLERVRRSLATVPPRFDALRMVRRYRDEAYRPLAQATRG